MSYRERERERARQISTLTAFPPHILYRPAGRGCGGGQPDKGGMQDHMGKGVYKGGGQSKVSVAQKNTFLSLKAPLFPVR